MKRMPYIIISATGLLLAVLLFTGCSSMHKNNTDNEIIGISLSQNHMNYTECFSFFLRQEEDKVLFDSQVNFYDEPSIVLEGIEVDQGYFEQLLALDKKHGITKSVLDYREKPSLLRPLDETIVTTTVYYADGENKSAKFGLYDEKLYQFFLNIATEYRDQSVVTIQAE